MKPFNIKVFTPKGKILDKSSVFLNIPGEIGDIGVYDDHTPSLVKLKIGSVKLTTANQSHHYFIPSGMAHITEEEVTILTSYLEPVEDIDKKRATEAKERAEGRLSLDEKDIDSSRAKDSLQRAETRLKLYLAHRSN